ncbi:MAG: PEP/pyruvate-binding domain-containing protein [Pseudomonadota bacterium]
MTEKWICWFDELGQEWNDRVGKKCANLGEMTRMGLQVPSGFALSLDAYRHFVSRTGADEEIKCFLGGIDHGFETIEQFNEAGERLRGIIESKPFPPEMKREILSYYRELSLRCPGGETLAGSTRSAGAKSLPGQYETYLNVIGESDLLENIIRVWSSTFNPRSLAARKQAGRPLEEAPIGVAVLQMVKARTAGVLFTADPNSRDPSRMIIEANWGLGESVVGGDAVPDVFILDKDTLKVIDRTLGSKGRVVTFKETGVAEEDASSEKRNAFCLTDEEAREIGRVGKILEAHFGFPQDIEWAIEENQDLPGSLKLLQTRPEVMARQKPPVDQVIDMMVGWL